MEFFFQWIVGSAHHGGAEAGEAFYAASRVGDGDPESWIREWTALADRVLARAEQSAGAGHTVSARQSYLRSYLYRRAALAFMDPSRDARFPPTYVAAREHFRAACSLFAPPIEPLSIAFEGAALPGYFMRGDGGPSPGPTLLTFGGADTFVEDTYFITAPAGAARGWNVVLVDLPGQGVLPMDGRTWRPDCEKPARAVIDAVLARPDVDPKRFAAIGISAGGYIASRVAGADDRVKAVVTVSLLLEFEKIFPDSFRTVEDSFAFRSVKAIAPDRVEAALRLMGYYEWRWGVRSLAELKVACAASHADPTLIRCPLLNVVSEQEFNDFPPAREWDAVCRSSLALYDRVVTPADEGAESHGVGTNLSLLNQIVFDWLEERLPDLGQ
jgi:hypothetical protein